MKITQSIAAFCVAIAGICGSLSAAAADTGSKDVLLKGDAKCMEMCHGPMAQVLPIGKTRHGTVADANTPTCTTCHGPSEEHMEKLGAVKPDRAYVEIFNRISQTPVDVRNDTCMSCHKNDPTRSHWAGSMHEARGLSCASCHQIHAATDKVRQRKTQPQVCFTCHKEQRVQTSYPSHHPIQEGKVVCSDCHQPHGNAGVRLMQRDSINNTCYTCHMEKRGPFLWEHRPVTEDCTNCHTPHGSTAENLLKVRMPFLCQQCHEGDSTHRGNYGSLNPTSTDVNALGARALVQGRGCVNCHTQIHGSNTPAAANANDPSADPRALRR